jgi:hypothetical protein
MVYKTVYTEVEVDVDMSEFDTEDLLEELEARGSFPLEGSGDAKEIVEKIWMLRRYGKDYQRELNDLIYRVLGKIV